MASKKNDDRPNVLVVGGGFAGNFISLALSKSLDHAKYNLILVNNLPYYVHRLGLLRLLAQPKEKLEEKINVPYDKMFPEGKGSFVQGKLVEVIPSEDKKGGKVKLEDGEEIEYAALVLATGSNWHGLVDYPEGGDSLRVDWREEKRKELTDAKRVVIVGGGAVGLELAGELKDADPEKAVTVVHANELPLTDHYPLSFRQRIKSAWEGRGVKFILGDTVELPANPGGEVKTAKGLTLTADVVAECFGSTPNTSYLSSLGSDVLTTKGHIKVRPTLQLKEYDSIFAAGDILDWDEPKQAAKVMFHGGVVVPNVISYLNGRPAAKQYKGALDLILITNGKTKGATWVNLLWGIQFGDWLTALLKSKDLLLPRERANLGYK